jgi:hypothetical protein
MAITTNWTGQDKVKTTKGHENIVKTIELCWQGNIILPTRLAWLPYWYPLRESTFIMPRGGGTEMFSGIKGRLWKFSIYWSGGYKLFKVLVQQGPGVFTPTLFNRIEGLGTH